MMGQNRPVFIPGPDGHQWTKLPVLCPPQSLLPAPHPAAGPLHLLGCFPRPLRGGLLVTEVWAQLPFLLGASLKAKSGLSPAPAHPATSPNLTPLGSISVPESTCGPRVQSPQGSGSCFLGTAHPQAEPQAVPGT